MNTASITDDDTQRPDPVPGLGRDLALWALVVLLVALAWWVGRAGFFKAGDDLGYWIGVAGGVLMLVLLLYPARKHLRVMRNAGRVKSWFWMHMIFGIGGPWLILVHSTFRIGSLNAGVALFSMVIVVTSGVVGRFLFVRVQRKLGGGHDNLRQLRDRLGLAGSQARSTFSFAPEIDARLRAFEARELPGGSSAGVPLWRLLGFPLRRWAEQRRCAALLDERLAAFRGLEGWTPERGAQLQRRAQRMLRRYFESVLRVAHYSLFDRLFALWHVAHMPFVVLLVVSAVVHVVAVHAY
jgi:hypothetical protein